MSRTARSVTVCSLLLLYLGLLGPQLARAETPRVLAEEIREFEILVKEKPTGKSLIRITEMDDGVTIVSTEVVVNFDFIIYVYRYELHGKELWQGNQLVAVDNRAVDNGTKLTVRAKIDSQGTIIEAAGKAATKVPALEMTTNFWRCPAFKGGPLSFLDVDKGTILSATAEHVGPDQILVAGNNLSCTRYRLRGTVAGDLCFDAKGRLVRQQTVEMGFPIELRLVRLTTNGSPLARR
jgi:hypothetical protein